MGDDDLLLGILVIVPLAMVFLQIALAVFLLDPVGMIRGIQQAIQDMMGIILVIFLWIMNITTILILLVKYW